MHTTVITAPDVREYFRDQVHSALENQHVEVDTQTTNYLVNLLTTFVDSKQLFEQSEDGPELRPLALHYLDAVGAPNSESSGAALKKLGDVALFISGVFSGSLNRKVVDVDYYIAMGCAAYGRLHELMVGLRAQSVASVFAELAAKFPALVDVLAEFGESSNLNSNSDVLRLYEIWLKTGSPRALQKLRRLGLQPAEAMVSRSHH